MVHHLEHNLFRLPVIHGWPVFWTPWKDFYAAEEDLREAAGITGHGG